jgi:hypothetical protein
LAQLTVLRRHPSRLGPHSGPGLGPRRVQGFVQSRSTRVVPHEPARHTTPRPRKGAPEGHPSSTPWHSSPPHASSAWSSTMVRAADGTCQMPTDGTLGAVRQAQGKILEDSGTQAERVWRTSRRTRRREAGLAFRPWAFGTNDRPLTACVGVDQPSVHRPTVGWIGCAEQATEGRGAAAVGASLGQHHPDADASGGPAAIAGDATGQPALAIDIGCGPLEPTRRRADRSSTRSVRPNSLPADYRPIADWLCDRVPSPTERSCQRTIGGT